MDYQRIAVLIPAYKPNERLITLVKELREAGFEHIVVVDDGGGKAYRPIFEALAGQAKVLTHAENQGKGAALKTGIRSIMKRRGMSIVTADADGQHTPKDIRAIAERLEQVPDRLILGVREKRLMPARSKAGNRLTCFFFGLTTGLWISDTQTGLRGLPASALARFAQIEGERYEYELNMLICARHEGIAVDEVNIQTVYFDDNASSHFNTWRDGFRIYKLLFRQVATFIGSSAISGLVDYSMYALLLFLWPGELLVATVGARAFSSTLNYLINREVVFKAQANAGSALRYYLLVAFVALLSFSGTKLLNAAGGMTELLAKPIVDLMLFLINYNIQRRLIFLKKRGPKAAAR